MLGASRRIASLACQTSGTCASTPRSVGSIDVVGDAVTGLRSATIATPLRNLADALSPIFARRTGRH